MKYRLFDYDLLGNNEDGYEVNDVYSSNITLNIEPTDLDAIIIKKVLKAIEDIHCKSYRENDFSVEGDDTPDSFIWLSYKHIPFCELRPESVFLGV